jgi:predicted aspartyl protease
MTGLAAQLRWPALVKRLTMLSVGIFALEAESLWADSPPRQAQPPVTAEQPTLTAEQAVLSFSNRRDRMTVPVMLDGRGPFPFVVDTGAERSVVSRELATTLALSAGPSVRVYAFTGVSDVETVRIGSLSVSRLGASAVHAPSFAIADLGAPGMLGIDALQGHRVSIDFVRRRMTLIPTRKRASGDIVVRASNRLGQLVVADAKFQGHPISVVIDTGSPISVGNRAMLALMKRPPRPIGPISVVAVNGQSFDANYVAVSAVRIGGVEVANLALAFADVLPFERFGLRDTPALILGMDTLRLFRRVDIDFANREIQFTMPLPPLNFATLCGRTSACKSVGVN